MFNGFIAIGIYTEDFKKTANFYKDVLRLKIRSFDPEKEFAEFTLGNVTLGLVNEKTANALTNKTQYFTIPQKGPAFTLTVEVESVEQIYENLKDNNEVQIVSPPHTTPWGWKIFCFKDPNECVWEVCELPKKQI